jgi:hypothetical protein
LSYINELESRLNFRTNTVCVIDGAIYGKYNVDSGLNIPEERRLISVVSVNPTKIDLQKGITTINSATIDLIDKDQLFSIFLGSDESSRIDKVVDLYVGRNTAPFGQGNFDWADYIKIGSYNIKDISKSGAIYRIKAVTSTTRIQKPIFNIQGNLEASINISDTSIQVINTDGDQFPSAGIIKIKDEFISYTGKAYATVFNRTTFTGCTRGLLQSVSIAHDAGEEVFEVFQAQENPVDIVLKILISGGGGGVYDVYRDGLGISPSLIDVSAIEAIRDSFFVGETHTHYFSNVPDTLKFLQTRLFVPNNLRIIEGADGKISLAVLDQTEVGADLPEIDKRDALPRPNWKISANEIRNKIIVKWDYSEGLKTFRKTSYFQDSDSITSFGVQSGGNLELYGVTTTGIVTDRAERFLQRFSTPKSQIDIRSFMRKSTLNVGDKIRFSSDELPQQGAALGLNAEVEILNKSIDFSTGIVKFGLIFTSYTNLRRGLIAPASKINSIVSQNEVTFISGQAEHYKEGFKVRLWDSVANEFETDPVNTIVGINGSTIIFENDWDTTLTTSHIIRFADYDNVSVEQLLYGFINLFNNDFPDNTGPYKIFV